MIKKNFYFIIIILFLINNCGFTPKYAGYKGIDFNLVRNEISGDRDLNNYIKSQIKRYENNRDSDDKNISIDLFSKFEKKAIAKDTKGNITKYNLVAIVEVTLIHEDNTKKITLKENFKIDKIEDSVEENNYILIVKKDFAKRIMDKIILIIRAYF